MAACVCFRERASAVAPPGWRTKPNAPAKTEPSGSAARSLALAVDGL